MVFRNRPKKHRVIQGESLMMRSNSFSKECKIVIIYSKNYLVAQKAEYMRFSNQINSMIQNSK